MEINQSDTDKLTGMGLMGSEVTEIKLLEPKLPETEWVIRRPNRVQLTAEESIRRTEDFINNPKRREQFIASIRKSKG